MKVFKTGDIVKAKDLNDNFNEKVNTNLSNLPAIPVNKGGTGRTNGTVSYADRAGTAEVAKKLESDGTSDVAGLIDIGSLVSVGPYKVNSSGDDYCHVWCAAPSRGKKWLCIYTEQNFYGTDDLRSCVTRMGIFNPGQSFNFSTNKSYGKIAYCLEIK